METAEYERLVQLYLDCIYRVALSGCRNHADAEDIVQQTFLKLLVAAPQFEDDTHARKWLIRVAVNACRSLWRTPWRHCTTALEQCAEMPAFSTPAQSALYEAVMALPPKDRQAIHLYYFEDCSIREIAKLMHLSETAVQTRLYRARKRLKDELKEA